jgi:hypothetical protein
MYLVTPDNKNFLRVHDRTIADRLAENIGGSIFSTTKPIEVLISRVDNTKHVAIFNMNEGLMYATMNQLGPTSDYNAMLNRKGYSVIAGNIYLVVNETDFPEFERKPAF